MSEPIWHDAETETAPFGRIWVAHEARNGWQVAEARRAPEIARQGVFYVKLATTTAGITWLFMRCPLWSDSHVQPPPPDQVAEQGALW